MATQFYEEEYSPEVQANFKKLYEGIKDASTVIYTTDLYKPGARTSKEKLMRERMEHLQRVIKSQAQNQFFNAIKQESCNMVSTAEDSMDDLLSIKFQKKVSNP